VWRPCEPPTLRALVGNCRFDKPCRHIANLRVAWSCLVGGGGVPGVNRFAMATRVRAGARQHPPIGTLSATGIIERPIL